MINVLGVETDAQTRCAHYRTARDIVALKFACCGEWYPCHLCHKAVANHQSEAWAADKQQTRAVVCGVCWREMTITEYVGCGSTCPYCQSAFNPGCQEHHSIYFG